MASLVGRFYYLTGSHTVTLQTSTAHNQTAFEKGKEQMCGTAVENEHASHTASHPTPPENEPGKPGAICFSSLKRGILSTHCRKAEGSHRALCYETRSEGRVSITLAPVRAELAISLDKNRQTGTRARYQGITCELTVLSHGQALLKHPMTEH